MLEYNVSCLLVLIWLKEKEANRLFKDSLNNG